MSYSVRTLVLTIAALAAILALWSPYQRAALCRMQWLAAGSLDARSLFPQPIIESLPDGKFRLRYYPLRNRIQSLLPATRLSSNYKLLVDRETLEIVAEEAAHAQAQLDALRTADVLKPGVFVIRGRVVEADGSPLARATIDLMGSYVFINHFQTRDDGTFTMCLADGPSAAPAGSRCFFRVRAAEETADRHVRWNSPTFSLDPAVPERDLLIVIPERR